jgi:hypothetical protein
MWPPSTTAGAILSFDFDAEGLWVATARVVAERADAALKRSEDD